jgi:hypothetical protein
MEKQAQIEKQQENVRLRREREAKKFADIIAKAQFKIKREAEAREKTAQKIIETVRKKAEKKAEKAQKEAEKT